MPNDYKVGYGNPPRNWQFKKGQSGNPTGRPKMRTDAGTSDIVSILSEPVVVRKGGKEQLMSPFEASIRKLTSRALNDNNVAAALELIRLCEEYDVILPPPMPEGTADLWIVPRNFTCDEWSKMYHQYGPPPWPGERSGLVE